MECKDKLNILEDNINVLLDKKNILENKLVKLNDKTTKNNEKKEIKKNIKIINDKIKCRKNNIYMVKKEQKYLSSLKKFILNIENKLKANKILTLNNDTNYGICSNCDEMLNNMLNYKSNIDFMVETEIEYRIF